MSIEHAIEQFIVEEIDLEGTLSEHADLIESDVLDSAGIVALLGFLEEKYGVQIDEDVDLVPDNFQTITAIAAFVRRKAPALEAG